MRPSSPGLQLVMSMGDISYEMLTTGCSATCESMSENTKGSVSGEKMDDFVLTRAQYLGRSVPGVVDGLDPDGRIDVPFP